jgi:hypothetical protein
MEYVCTKLKNILVYYALEVRRRHIQPTQLHGRGDCVSFTSETRLNLYGIATLTIAYTDCNLPIPFNIAIMSTHK